MSCGSDVIYNISMTCQDQLQFRNHLETFQSKYNMKKLKSLFLFTDIKRFRGQGK